MPLAYDPNDMGSGGPAEGDYPFKVVNSQEEKYSSGNEGLTLTIEFIANDRILTTWCRFPYKKRLKALREMCDGIGVRFDPPPEPEDFLHKSGTAFFVKDKKGYLNPEAVHPKKAKAESFVSTPKGDDVPF